MKDLKQYNIQFVGLKEGIHLFNYKIENKFFDAFNYNEFVSSDVNIDLHFTKKSTLIELVFEANGTVEVPCDITNELYHQKIEATLPIVVKFGPEYNDDNEEILILPHEAYELNVAQFIYEMIVLAIPTKRIHPDVENGTMQSEILNKLEELEVKKTKEVENIDPRWDKLKNLITEKKT
ncbi:YceD family protein [Polaribacter marinivivus]|uniref:YceD family protein n=1 Tax=Polaribacter marinivivus TaxID=1524260 RepID=A0ABV8R9L4_9FLAO